MTTKVLSQSEFYDIYKSEVQSKADEFTDFSEGSIHDIIAGAVSTCCNEVSELIVSEFSKTFFDLAEGSDIDRLAVDHFGSSFSRPAASFSSGEVTFSRANTDKGNCTIPAGTIVKTKKDSSGVEIRFSTVSQVIMTGLSIKANIVATVAGSSGNVVSGAINTIESALTDQTIVVENELDIAGGENTFSDAEYREWLKQKILSLAGATEASVKAAALSVSGVYMAVLVTEKRTVIDYDIETQDILQDAIYFSIPYPVLYISDENGNSSQALIDAVKSAIFGVKACGVDISVKGATAIEIDWTGSLTLNPAGPNYAELSSDLSKIKETMENYINKNIQIGSGFNRTLANEYIMAVWGPDGTGDITNFSTSVPSGNVSGLSGVKLVSGTMGLN